MGLVKDFIIQLVLVIYIISPIDIVPDIMPVIGWIDDIFALVIFIVKLSKYEKILRIIKVALKILIPLGIIIGLVIILFKVFK